MSKRISQIAITTALITVAFAAVLASVAQTEPALAQSDSFVAVVADAAGLPCVPSKELPRFGTFWEVRNTVPCVPLPLPCPPLDRSLPVYAIDDGHFIVDRSAGPMVVTRRRLSTNSPASLIQQQVDDLASFIALIQEKQAIRKARLAMGALDDEDPGPQYSPPVYASNDLWLEVSITNLLASFVIHTPDSTNYDLFGTTNLSGDTPGLNAINWVWLFRTDVGQTNSITVTNLWPDKGFFRLGTMLDSDGDGLTDAFENLVSHTDPANWDTDGDGISDYDEARLYHTNPNSQDSDGDGILDEPFKVLITQPSAFLSLP